MSKGQEGGLSRRTFVAASAASVAALAAAGALAGCSEGEESSSSSSSESTATEEEVLNEWEELLKEAEGQTVTFLAWGAGGADAYVQQCWEELTTRVEAEYGITLQCIEYDQAEYQKIITDLEEGLDATYDLFWFTGAMFTQIVDAGEGILEDKWMADLPNDQYLDYDNPLVTFDGVRDTKQAEAPFQTCQQALVYSQDNWSHTIGWDESDGDVNGLFTNLSELAEWVKKYPGKFTYMDLTGAGDFHGILFCKAILSELKDDGNGGWTTVYDESDDAETRRKKIQDQIDDWYNWSISDDASEEAFYDRAAYLWAYLNELAPNLMQGDNGPFYVPTAPDMMSYVMAGDLACTFTTCTSISSRVAASPESYMANPAIYLMQTSVSYWDYAIIPANSQHQAAAKVVCNLLLDPEWQAEAFEITGNGYTVSYDKLDSDQKAAFDDVFAAMGNLSPTQEEIELQAYVDDYGNVSSWIVSGWSQYVNNA